MKSEDKHLLKSYFWILSYYKHYITTVIFFILTSIGIAFCEICIPYFLRLFIDDFLPNNDIQKFKGFFIILIIIVIFLLIQQVINNILGRSIKEKISRDIQLSVLKHLRALGLPYFESTPTGDILTLTNTDVQQVQKIYQQYTPELVQRSIFTAVFVVLIFIMQPVITLMATLFFCTYFIFSPYILNKTKMLLKRQIDSQKELNKKIYDSISGILEVRAYSAEQWDTDRLLKKSKIFTNIRMKSLFFRHLRGGVPGMIIELCVLIIYILGMYFFRQGNLTIGELLAFAIYYEMAAKGICILTIIWSEQYHTLFHAQKLYDFIHEVPKVSETEQPVPIDKVKGEFSFERVSFSYNTEREQALHKVNMVIKSGEKVALVGTSGSGKSTMLKLIGRFYDPCKGKVKLDGIHMKDLSVQEIRETMGYVFQETYLFGSSIMENIRFAKPEATDEEIIEAAKSAFAHDFIVNTKEGYDTVIGERGVKLSGGEKQRIAIARLFLKNPPIICLDEATSSLDNISEGKVKEAIHRVMEGRTVITVAHRLSTIRDYDKIYVFHEGSIVESGSWDELLNQKSFFYNLYNGGVQHA